MRKYSIKRGHKADINMLLKKYFGIDGNINDGVEFEADSIGKIYMKKEGSYLFVEITPPDDVKDDYEAIKKWNAFLYEATGRTAKERRKMLEKEFTK